VRRLFNSHLCVYAFVRLLRARAPMGDDDDQVVDVHHAVVIGVANAIARRRAPCAGTPMGDYAHQVVNVDDMVGVVITHARLSTARVGRAKWIGPAPHAARAETIRLGNLLEALGAEAARAIRNRTVHALASGRVSLEHTALRLALSGADAAGAWAIGQAARTDREAHRGCAGGAVAGKCVRSGATCLRGVQARLRWLDAASALTGVCAAYHVDTQESAALRHALGLWQRTARLAAVEAARAGWNRAVDIRAIGIVALVRSTLSLALTGGQAIEALARRDNAARTGGRLAAAGRVHRANDPVAGKSRAAERKPSAIGVTETCRSRTVAGKQPVARTLRQPVGVNRWEKVQRWRRRAADRRIGSQAREW